MSNGIDFLAAVASGCDSTQLSEYQGERRVRAAALASRYVPWMDVPHLEIEALAGYVFCAFDRPTPYPMRPILIFRLADSSI